MKELNLPNIHYLSTFQGKKHKNGAYIKGSLLTLTVLSPYLTAL
jgi:hypothetical protein